jgi:hypothetical protein
MWGLRAGGGGIPTIALACLGSSGGAVNQGSDEDRLKSVTGNLSDYKRRMALAIRIIVMGAKGGEI